MKRPLLSVALVYVVGLLLAEAIQPPLSFLFTLAFSLLFLALAWTRARALLIWPLLIVVGWVNLASRTTVVSPNDLRVVAGREPALVTVRGTLAETPTLRIYGQGEAESSRTLARVRVSALTRGEKWELALGPVLVSTKGDLADEFFAGREVEITGVLAPPPLPLAPGLFDYRHHLALQGIYFQLKSDSTNDWRAVDSKPNRPPFTDRFLAWSRRTLARDLPEPDEPLRLMWAMSLGWKTALTGEVNEPFMKSGTMHIFAISGLHIALIAGILVSLLRVLRVPRVGCGLVVIPLIWFYTAATGWQSSAIRSTLMMTIIIGGWSLRRPTDLINSLAAAAFVILLWDPPQLFQASFQLSFFVVLSIALFLPPLEKLRDRLLAADPMLAPEVMTKWQRTWRSVLRVLTTSLVTSLAAWLGSLPLTAYYFHLFSPVTLLANLVIVPMASFALMSNLGSLICGDWMSAVGELFNHSGWFWMLGMMKLSRWATEMPGAYFYVASPSAITFVGYYGLLIGTMSGWLWRPERRWRTAAAMGLVAAFYGWQSFATRKDVELTVLPLNGGHAEYLDAAGSSSDWLMDCGNTNSVEFVIQPFLHAKGVNHLPRLMLTHGDLKHVGGAELLASEFNCHDIYASSFRFRSAAYRRILATMQHEPYHLRTLDCGDQAGPWRILHPTAADESTQADDGALVCQAEFNGVKILLLSDLGQAGQNLLLDRTNDLYADIVVSGLPAQSNPLGEALLDAIRPRVIIIADSELPATARASNRLKERLARRHGAVIYTRETGAVTVLFRAGSCEISTSDLQHFKLENLPGLKSSTTPPKIKAVE
jgi:competence protein ComEC